jgi:AhpD family alkylhydroperoxidase
MPEASRIPLLERESASPDAQKIYDALLAARGVVPNMFKVLAYRPEIAQGVAGFLKPLLSDAALPGFYKELIAIRVSQHHNSAYAVRAHSISAQQKGASERQIADVANFETGAYSEKKTASASPTVCIADPTRWTMLSTLRLNHLSLIRSSSSSSSPLRRSKCFRVSSMACAFQSLRRPPGHVSLLFFTANGEPQTANGESQC